MKTSHKTKKRIALFSLLLAGTLVIVGCNTAGPKRVETSASQPGANVSNGLSGSELWSRNCNRCHNTISPDRYSDAQWEVATHHMRVRANLTGEDRRKILEFLKRAN